MDFIYGKNSVLEALEAGREINKIIISKNLHGDNKLNKIIELAKQNNVVFQFVDSAKFKQYQEFSHQGVIAYVSALKYTDLDEFLERTSKQDSVVSRHDSKTTGEARVPGNNTILLGRSLVILDGVEDPHNLGSIIRTAVCAGVSGIIIPSHRSAAVNSVVEKTSAGAVNHIPVIKVNSLTATVQKLKNNNWWIIAADAQANDNYCNIDYCDMNFALIMGAEHSGVSKSLLKAADFTVKIPMPGDFNSLNVTNAFSVIIFESVRQKGKHE